MRARRLSGPAAFVVALIAAATVLGPATPARADLTLAQARARAATLATQLDAIDAELEAASEDYGAASTQLAVVVGQLVQADEAGDQASLVARETTAHNDDVAAQMYMSGGPGALYASVLDAGDISDVLSRIASVDAVVRGDVLAQTQADSQARAVAQTQSELARLTDERRRLEAARAAAWQRVAMLRAQAAADLAAADAEVTRILAVVRAQQEAAAEAAARATDLSSLPWKPEPVPADALAAVDRAIAEATANPATPYAVGALRDARQWLGTPYSAGGGGVRGPSTGWCSSSAPDDGRDSSGACLATSTVGFDCSSLMLRVFSAAGRTLPRTSREQWKIGVHVPLSQIQPGDLLFWAHDTSNPASIHHVALYIGHGLMIHSPHTGDHVRVAQVYFSGLIGAVRPI